MITETNNCNAVDEPFFLQIPGFWKLKLRAGSPRLGKTSGVVIAVLVGFFCSCKAISDASDFVCNSMFSDVPSPGAAQ
jgi:hypothetical protein